MRAFLATLKPARREAGPAVRFETEPGRQLQADFVVLRRARSPMSAFVATLGYSRMTFVTFVPDESFESVRDSLLLAFDYLGGVPREVLFDNMKTVVLERDAYGDGKHRFHPGLLQLADDLGSGSGCVARIGPRPKARSSASIATSARASTTRC